jgi:MFS transporter, PPP family, 3-phenylpropionic acid transporter
LIRAQQDVLLRPVSAPTSVRRLQAHYFAIYAVFGSVTPYLSIYLSDHKGISLADIGIIFAVGQSAVLIMPMAMTYLADRYRLVRPLFVTLFSINVLAMAALFGAIGFWACLLCIAVNRLATQPQVALGDGLYFTLQADANQPRVSFSTVRVWGTIGFIAPSIAMFAAYQLGGGVDWLPGITALFATMGVINAWGLPMRSARNNSEEKQQMPTLAAAKVLAQPHLLLFCLGCGTVVFTNMAFYGFYPLYLTDQVGIAEQWVGPISSLGVAIEILYILGLERMKRRFGFGGIIALASVASLFRFACLAFLPTPFFAVCFQVFHGMTIVGFFIVPVMYLNAHASAGFRNSIQGLYVVLVAGFFSIAGNVFAGHVAELGLITLYKASLGICLLGVTLTGLSFWLAKRAHP